MPAYLVFDAENGKVLSHRSADKLWYPASTTKIMTAYVVFRAIEDGEISLASPVRVSKHALAQAPSKMGFKVGTVMTVDNALKMIIVRSANDIAVAIAESVGGSEEDFVARMNAEAARLGMTSTRFSNPNGLPDDRQWTTARDLAVLARAVWLDYPQYREYFRIPAIRHGKSVLKSANTLLERYRGANGMKTGYICASGFNIVASATRGERTIMAVVLGAESGAYRAEYTAKLLNRGFSTFVVGTRPSLASFRAFAVKGTPVNLRNEVCTAEGRAARAAREKKRAARPQVSALVPRFVLADPVRVYTGRATPTPPRVPLPRLRPDQGEQSAALSGDAAQLQ